MRPKHTIDFIIIAFHVSVRNNGGDKPLTIGHCLGILVKARGMQRRERDRLEAIEHENHQEAMLAAFPDGPNS